MASAGDIHSILYRGDVLKQPVPRYDPSKRVQRYFPKKAPVYAQEADAYDESSESDVEDDQQKIHLVKSCKAVQPDTSIQDRRLHLIKELKEKDANEIPEYKEQLTAGDFIDDGDQRRVVKRRREVVESGGRVLEINDTRIPKNKGEFKKRIVAEPIILSSKDTATVQQVLEPEQFVTEDERRAERRRRALELRKQEDTDLLAKESSAVGKVHSENLDHKEQAYNSGEEVDDTEDETSDDDDDGDDDDTVDFLRPVFIPSSQRHILKEQALVSQKEQEEVEKKTRQELEERKKDSKVLLAETIMIEEAEEQRRQEEAARGSWDPEHMPDDRDDVDEEMEYELWRTRELKRILRDKEEEAEQQRIQEHIEKRRQMTDAERKEDDRRLDALQPKAEEKKKYSFMQKYYHKGAFFQDLGAAGAEPLYLRDFNAPVGEDAVDKNLLPAPMRLRRGQFGKAGRVKHTHLADVDTTDFSAPWAQKSSVMKKTHHLMAGHKGAHQLNRPSSHKNHKQSSHLPTSDSKKS